MGNEPTQPDPLISLLPLFIMQIVIAICAYFLAKDKGRSPVKYVLLSLIPGFGWVAFWYLIGATNLRVETKIDAIMQALKEQRA